MRTLDVKHRGRYLFRQVPRMTPRRIWYYAGRVYDFALNLALAVSVLFVIAICAGLTGCGGGDDEPEIVCTAVQPGPFLSSTETLTCKEQK